MKQTVSRKVVIFSSAAAALEVVQGLAANLSSYLGVSNVQVWNEEFFRASEHPWETLTGHIRDYDFAVAVMTGEETLCQTGGRQLPAPKLNVILECGLAAGALGKTRCFIVHPDDLDMDAVISNLKGITCVRYDATATGNWEQTTRTAAHKIAKQIEECEERVVVCNVELLGRDERNQSPLGDLNQRIARAKHEIWISGTTLKRTASGDVYVSAADADIRIILPDYRSIEAMTFAAMTDERSVDDEKDAIVASATTLSKITTRRSPVEVRFLDYCPAYSFFAVDAPSQVTCEGYICIELDGYQTKAPRAQGFAPGFVLEKDRADHRAWYGYFEAIWGVMWAHAVPHTEAVAHPDGPTSRAKPELL